MSGGGYDMDAPRYSFGALTMLGDGWPNGAHRYTAPEADEPTAAWTPRCEEDEHYAKEDD